MFLINYILTTFVIFAISVNGNKINCEDNLSDDAISQTLKVDQQRDALSNAGLNLVHETVNEQSDQPSSGERFVAVHVAALGNTEVLKPTLVGLSNMAITFLPKNLILRNVLWATREVVAGVRYNLIVNVNDINNPTGNNIVCELIVLEKSWIIINNGGDKLRILQYTNCTASDNYLDDYSTTSNNNDDDNFNFNPLFTHKNTEISDDMLKKLEAQIITSKPQQTQIITNPSNKNNNNNNNNNSNNNSADDDAIFKYLNAQILKEKVTSTENINSIYNQNEFKYVTIKSNDFENSMGNIYDISTHSTVLQSDILITTDRSPEESKLNQETRQLLDNIFIPYKQNDSLSIAKTTYINENQDTQQVINDLFYINESENKPIAVVKNMPDDKYILPKIEGVILTEATNTNRDCNHDYNLQNTQQQTNKNHNEHRNKRESTFTEKEYFLKIASRALEQLDHIDLDEFKRIPLEILNIKKIENSVDYNNKGTIYEMKIYIGNSHCIEESTNFNDCKKSLIKESTKICYMEVRVKRDDVNVISSQCLPSKRLKRDNRIVGGPMPVTDHDEIEAIKKDVLNKLSSLEDGENYNFLQIVEATKKVVSGVLYEIKADIKLPNSKTETCKINVWKRIWLPNSTDVTINCNNKPTGYRKRRSLINDALKKDQRVTTTQSEIIVEKLRNKREERVKRQLGAPQDITINSDIEERAKNILAKLSSLEGSTYAFARVIKAQKQVVEGSLLKMEVEVRLPNSETKTCNLEIWERLWLPENGTQVTILCNNKETVYRQKRSLLYDRLNTPFKSESEVKSEHMFTKFMLKYNKNYHTTMEHNMRYRIFKNNLMKIQMLNEKEEGTAKYGISEFSDFTLQEYKLRTGLWKRHIHENEIPNSIAEIPENLHIPKEFDWRTKNVVTEVKNQGNCGSCWAFSVTGNIEGLHAVKMGVLEEYSEQELLDCDTLDGACSGGLPDNAYKAIEQIGGLELESDYPYKAKKNQCHFNKTLSHVQVSGFVDLPQNETAMAQWLIQNGPISIGINANAMQFYRGGISHPWRPLCRHASLDHGVLIVGFGVSEYPKFNKTLPYWIIKNSWGPKWGEQGYYRIYRGDNSCGVNSMASSAVLS